MCTPTNYHQVLLFSLCDVAVPSETLGSFGSENIIMGYLFITVGSVFCSSFCSWIRTIQLREVHCLLYFCRTVLLLCLFRSVQVPVIFTHKSRYTFRFFSILTSMCLWMTMCAFMYCLWFTIMSWMQRLGQSCKSTAKFWLTPVIWYIHSCGPGYVFPYGHSTLHLMSTGIQIWWCWSPCFELMKF